MATRHNVRVDAAADTAERAKTDPSAAQLKVDLTGEWRVDETKPQFGGTVKFPKGELFLEADFPPFLSGEGRMPSPLIYCFYGALSCYTATFAMQAAMVGMSIRSLRGRLRLNVGRIRSGDPDYSTMTVARMPRSAWPGTLQSAS